ncbi:hypothetical protein LINGRAHAP2_LOCUS12285 [Linum grandiflorum]
MRCFLLGCLLLILVLCKWFKKLLVLAQKLEEPAGVSMLSQCLDIHVVEGLSFMGEGSTGKGEGREVGYWPADLFKNLKGAASLIEWGGKVINSNPEGFHTVTQMGSGHFPREGDTKAAWFQNLEYADKDGFFNPAADIVGHATRPECYDILTQPWSEEAGDETIDCVDIYKQPAFNHPLLKNHTLQLKPSSYPTGSKSIVSRNSTKLTHLWHKNGESCPEGTIPILRSSAAAHRSLKNKHDRLRTFNNAEPDSLLQIPHPEFATVSMIDSNLYGVNADMSVWNPKVQPYEQSSSQIWLTTDKEGEKLEAIETGWTVSNDFSV